MKLEIKVVLLTILILLVLGTAASGILLYYQRQHAIAQFQETAEAITASMQRSLEQWMLTGDRAFVQDAVASTSGADFIREATVYAPDGQIAASSDLAKIGKLDTENYLTAVLKGGSRTSHEIPGDSQG